MNKIIYKLLEDVSEYIRGVVKGQVSVSYEPATDSLVCSITTVVNVSNGAHVYTKSFKDISKDAFSGVHYSTYGHDVINGFTNEVDNTFWKNRVK